MSGSEEAGPVEVELEANAEGSAVIEASPSAESSEATTTTSSAAEAVPLPVVVADTAAANEEDEKPAVVAAEEGDVDEYAVKEVPDTAIHETLFLQIFTDDKRMFHLPYSTAIRSQRLKEIIDHEREAMDAQRNAAVDEFDSRSDPNAHSLNVVLQSSLKLDGHVISEDAYIALCTYFELTPNEAETDPRIVAFDDFDQLADRIVAFEYMGIPSMTLRLSKLLHKLLMDSHDPAEARTALKINDYGNFKSDNQYYLSAFGPAPAPVNGAPAEADEEAVSAAVGANVVPRRIMMRRDRVREFPDSDVCMHCSVRLQLPLKPKYVCRACGGSFCGDHCFNTFVLPFDPVGEQPKTSLFGFMKSAVSGKMLVCNECYNFLSGAGNEQIKYFQVMRAAALPIVSARRAGTLSMALSVAAGQYLNLMCVLQNRLPCQSFSPIERRMMLANKRTFAGHSLWTLQLLRVLDYDDQRHVEEARALLHPDRINGGISSCQDAMCTVSCSRSGLTISACVTALNKATYVLPEILRMDLIDLIARHATNEDLLLHMPALVHCIKYDRCPQTVLAKSPQEAAQMGCPLSAFLLQRALSIDSQDESSVRLACEFYWRCCCEQFDSLRELFIKELSTVARAVADQLIELQGLSHALQVRADGSVLPRLQPLFTSRHMMVPFHASSTIRYIDSVSSTPLRKSPFFVRYNTQFEMAPDASTPSKEMLRTNKTLAFYNQDVHFALLLRHCLQLCRREFSHSPDADLSTLRIEVPELVCTSRKCGFSDIIEPVVALRTCFTYDSLMEKLSTMSDRKPEELVAQMKRSAAFLAAFSYLTGFVFTDLVVTPSGVLFPADLDMIIVQDYTSFSMLHHFFYQFAKDADFVELSTKFFMSLRSLSSAIYMAFRVYFDVDDLAPYQKEFGKQFVSHLSRYSLFNIPPMRAQKLYAEAINRIVTDSQSQFEVIRKKTGESLSAIWATISAVPSQLFGGSGDPSVEIRDEPVEAGNVGKAEAEVEGEDAVAKEDSAPSTSSGAFKLKP